MSTDIDELINEREMIEALGDRDRAEAYAKERWGEAGQSLWQLVLPIFRDIKIIEAGKTSLEKTTTPAPAPRGPIGARGAPSPHEGTFSVAMLGGVSRVSDAKVCGGLGDLRDAGFPDPRCASSNQWFSAGGLVRGQFTNLVAGGQTAFDLGFETGYLPLAGKLTQEIAADDGVFRFAGDGFYETRAGFVALAPQLRFGRRVALVIRAGPAYWTADSGSSGRLFQGQTILDEFAADQENSGIALMWGGDLLVKLSDSVSIGPSFVAMHQKDGEGDNRVDSRVRQFNVLVRFTP